MFETPICAKITKPNPKMAIRVNLLHPNFLSPLQRSNLSLSKPTFSHLIPKISCSLNDTDLASGFASEVEKLNTQQLMREKAMEKSREILFREMCKSFDMNEDEMKKKWEAMDDDDKWVFVKGFVSDWGELFYPLSVGSVKDMVDEHLDEEGSVSSSDSNSFSGFMEFWGFSRLIHTACLVVTYKFVFSAFSS